jgi:hypothetical protein
VCLAARASEPLDGLPYAQLKESIHAGLILSTRLKAYLDEIQLIIDEDGVRLDFTALEEAMDARYAEDPANA